MPHEAPIDDPLLDRLEELAHLDLPPGRRRDLGPKLQHLVDAFAALQAADFGDAPADQRGPAIGPGQAHELRDDVAEAASDSAHTLQNAPQQAADSFVVPRVVEP